MSKDKYDDQDENEETGLSFAEQAELEDLIVKAAFNNSFNVITKRKTFDEILSNKSAKAGSTLMAHDPEKDMPTESLENMMAYFVDEEEYEKCAEIRDLINKK
tara:strand:- start:5669 stop:5977 length:309 start_codon:yes stop_codon:yes gene_type:complete